MLYFLASRASDEKISSRSKRFAHFWLAAPCLYAQAVILRELKGSERLNDIEQCNELLPKLVRWEIRFQP